MKRLALVLVAAAVLTATASPAVAAIRPPQTQPAAEKAIPNVVGMNWKEATAHLVLEGFSWDLDLDWDCPPSKWNKITKQNAAGGTMAAPKTVVTVWYMPAEKGKGLEAAADKNVQWVRTGPIFASNDTEGRMPKLMQVSAGGLTYSTTRDDKAYSNSMTWSEPPAIVNKGDVVTLTMSSSAQEGWANVGGWWNIRGHDKASYKGESGAGSDKNWRRTGDPHSATCSFKFDPTESKAMIQVSAGHDPAPDTWVLVTYTYTRRSATSSPVSGTAEEAAAKKHVLDMSPEEFAKDKDAQKQLYDMAVKMRDWQKQYGEGILKQLGIPTRDKMVVSIIKRDNFDQFVQGVIDKCKRNKYERISQMEDIARGRFNLRSADDVEKVVGFMFDNPALMDVVHVENPRRPQDGGGFGYPRYHVIMQDTQTGLRFEWQCGTKATSDLYETPGVPIPDNVTLGPGMHTDIHDIEYDILRSIAKDKDNPGLHEELGLPAIHARVDAVSAQTGLKGDSYENPEAALKELHALVGAGLKKVVDKMGPDYIKKFYH